jgi:hypothetical protein
MAKIRADRIKETSLFTGTNDVALLGATTGFKAFGDVCQDGDTFDYAITHENTPDWETGTGTYIFSTNTVARTTVTGSSNSNNKVDFGAGYKTIFITVNSNTFTELDKNISKTAATALAVALGA